MKTYRYISADSHVHNGPERWANRVPEKYRDRLPKRIQLPTGGEAMVDEDGRVSYGGTGHFKGHEPEEFDPTILHYDEEAGYGPAEQRLREMDADEGVDAEILFSFTPSAFGVSNRKDKDMAVAVFQAYNGFLAEEFCAYAPDRLLGIGVLPNRGVEEDIAELEHCARLGLRGVQLSAYPSGRPFPTEEDDRFWAAALDLEMPVTIHTSMYLRTSGRGDFMLEYPIEPEGYRRPPIDLVQRISMSGTHHCGALELSQMILAGVFDRFPNLKIFWAENNISWIPGFLEQMDINYARNRFWAERLLGLKPLARPPSEYVREHAYWGFFDDPIGVRLRHDVGVDHIMWGGDFPHEPSHWPHSMEYMENQLAGVPEDEKRKMMCENAIQFLHRDRWRAGQHVTGGR
jgi:uncharacterized protein